MHAADLSWPGHERQARGQESPFCRSAQSRRYALTQRGQTGRFFWILRPGRVEEILLQATAGGS
jgi:hypothetical protein